MLPFLVPQPEYGWLDNVWQYHGGNHAYESGEAHWLDGRVVGYEHGCHGDDEDEGREEDGGLVVGKYRGAFLLTVAYQSVHDEDAVVHADTEDERRYDDVDKVEAYAEDCHCSQ